MQARSRTQSMKEIRFCYRVFRKRDAMTKPSYEELRITKHSGSPQIADSASDSVSDQAATETRCEHRKFGVASVPIIHRLQSYRCPDCGVPVWFCDACQRGHT